MATPYCLCLVTVGDQKTAASITDLLLKEKLAACVSALPGLNSASTWEGRTERASEILLIIKTRTSLRDDVSQAVRGLHTYSVPEIIFFDIADGNKAYLDWLGASTPFAAKILKDKDNNIL